MYTKCLALLALLALPQMAGAVKYVNSRAKNACDHFITLSLQGGEGNTLYRMDTYPMKSMLGADGQFTFAYEVRKSAFFFNVGLNAQYSYHRSGMKSWTEQDPNAVDYTGDARTIRYNYTDFVEAQKTLSASVPVQFGVYFTPNFYAALGAKVSMPLLRNYTTKANLMTDGLYDMYFGPLEDDAHYRYYPATEISRSGRYNPDEMMQIFVTPTFEMGYRFYISQRLAIRLAGYAEYTIPVVKAKKFEQPALITYGEMNFTDRTMTFDQFTAPIDFHSALDNPTMNGLSRLAVGAKLTFVINVTPQHRCYTCDDETGRPYIQPKGIRRKGDTSRQTDSKSKSLKGGTLLHDPNAGL